MSLTDLLDDTRGDWDAAPADAGEVNFESLANKDYFLTHHDGGTRLYLEGKSHAECLKRVKAVQTFHMGGDRNWSDIGYNTLCCPHGRLIEGRGILAVGAQCPGYNRYGIGSQLMTGGSDPLPDVMLNRQRRFYDELRELRGGDAMAKMGHRDGVSTDCPGDAAYAWVRAGMPYQGTPIQPPDPKIPGTNLPLLDVDGSLGPATTYALGVILKARGYAVTPSKSVTTELVKAIQTDLNRAGKRDRDGRTLTVDGKGFGSNSGGRYPAEGWTRTISALQAGHGDRDPDGYFSADDSTEVRKIQNDVNYGGTKDSPLYTG